MRTLIIKTVIHNSNFLGEEYSEREIHLKSDEELLAKLQKQEQICERRFGINSKKEEL